MSWVLYMLGRGMNNEGRRKVVRDRWRYSSSTFSRLSVRRLSRGFDGDDGVVQPDTVFLVENIIRNEVSMYAFVMSMSPGPNSVSDTTHRLGQVHPCPEVCKSSVHVAVTRRF